MATPESPILHLVSDATGSTLQSLARACLTQFNMPSMPLERFWNLIRSEEQLGFVIESIKATPGLVLYTFVNEDMAKALKKACRENEIPCVSVLDPILKGLSSYLDMEVAGRAGGQYRLDQAYFERIDALDFALHYDDGQQLKGLDEADVILVGCSRTSKTPTCIYLANRGVKAANIPFVHNVPFPQEVLELTNPMIVGLTESPERLLEVRKARLKNGDGDMNPLLNSNMYLDETEIEREMRAARRLFSQNNWPVIDVTRRSVEETAAEIITLLTMRRPALRLT